MIKSVSKLDFFKFLSDKSRLYNIQSITSYSCQSYKYYTTFFYVDSENRTINLCYLDFDTISNLCEYSIEEKYER